MQDYQTIKSVLAQANNEQSRELFQEMLRNSVRLALVDALAQEVEMLCGPKYGRGHEAPCRRAGSEKGHAFINGTKEEITRPRVRDDDGEVALATYELAKDRNLIFDQVVDAISAGMPVRGVESCHGGAIKRTQASAMWVQKSASYLEELRTRSLESDEWLAMQIDGLFIGKDCCVIVALGIRLDGRKEVLDFEPGASENFECAKLLCERIAERGFGPAEGRRLLVVRDGSKALQKAVSAVWPSALQQECLVHAERLVLAKLPKKAVEEAVRLFRRLRLAEGKESGEAAFEELVTYLGRHNADAASCLTERKDALLAFHRLDVPAALNGTFLSTNHIENLIGNWRQETSRVKRWDLRGDQVSRWTAVGLLEAEKGFRRVRGHRDLHLLAKALAAPEMACVPESSATASDSSTPAISATAY
jgi:transposase-like protein